jgi:hypothetical protein
MALMKEKTKEKFKVGPLGPHNANEGLMIILVLNILFHYTVLKSPLGRPGLGPELSKLSSRLPEKSVEYDSHQYR